MLLVCVLCPSLLTCSLTLRPLALLLCFPEACLFDLIDSWECGHSFAVSRVCVSFKILSLRTDYLEKKLLMFSSTQRSLSDLHVF